MSRPRHTLVDLPERVDPRGTLSFGQQGDHIPFAVKRYFVLYGVPEGSSRGGHAHRAQHQFLIMASGSAKIAVDDGKSRAEVLLDRPNFALYAPPMLWLELRDFSQGAVCLVLVSDVYSENDYIRDRAEFLRLTGGP